MSRISGFCETPCFCANKDEGAAFAELAELGAFPPENPLWRLRNFAEYLPFLEEFALPSLFPWGFLATFPRLSLAEAAVLVLLSI